MLMVPLHNGQQVLAVLQGQLADMGQALLLKGAQDSAPVAGHRRLLQLQRCVQAGVSQIGHWPWRNDNCSHSKSRVSRAQTYR